MRTSRIVVISIIMGALLTLIGCRGDVEPPPQEGDSGAATSEQASEIVAVSFHVADQESLEALREMTITRSGEKYYLHQEVLLSKDDIDSAWVEITDAGPEVRVLFTEEGKVKMTEAYRAQPGKRLGVVIDSQLVSAPLLTEELPQEGFTILSGDVSDEEARRILQDIVVVNGEQ